jgi:hypothetical protein
VELRVKTKTGRVLCLDMELRWRAITDATDDYDIVDGELVEHHYDLTKPDEIDRFFGRRPVQEAERPRRGPSAQLCLSV